MATACFLSGTVSKYTSTSTGTASGDIANWEFNVNTKNIVTEDQFTIALENTVDTDTGVADNEVAPGKIAPGTKGTFTITLTNSSEVKARYEIDYTTPNNPALSYRVKVGAGEYSESSDTLADITALDNKIMAIQDIVVITVEWTWAYDDALNPGVNDVSDTTIGSGTDDFVITAKVTATQVD
jgi:hypothetical protein